MSWLSEGIRSIGGSNVGGIAGGLIGFAIGGPAGAYLGYNIGAAAGGAYDARNQRKEAERFASQEEYEAFVRKQKMRARLAHVQGLFGEGDSVKARENKAKIEGQLDVQRQRATEIGDDDTEAQFAEFSTRERQRLASRGLDGSSVAAGSRDDGLAGLALGRAQSRANATAGVEDTRGRLMNERMRLEDLARQDPDADVNQAAALRQQEQIFRESNQNLLRRTVGDLFGQAGGVLRTDAVSRGYGYRGVSALDSLNRQRTRLSTTEAA